jgi:hypothetical protein
MQRHISNYSRSGKSRATWTLRYSTEVAFFAANIGQTVAIEGSPLNISIRNGPVG